ncbi:MAG TPA: type II secretion system F family protein [Candidatus Paceibacterota bacterium]|nr:type II secretion system F family protein [Candidatus Paceibacterota bacterium]
MITPGQLAKRAEFYQQLGQLVSAGIPIVSAFQQVLRHPPAFSYRRYLQPALADLESGFTLAETLRRLDWLPEFDLTLIEAGERSGRLDLSFRSLGEFYAERAQMLRQMLAELAYPVALLHFAVFIFPFARLFLTGDWVRYLAQTVLVLLPLYAAVGLLVLTLQSRHGEAWRAFMESVLDAVPVIGSARRHLALARLCAALEGLLNAGISIVEGWEVAAAASASPRLRRIVAGWRAQVEAGRTPAELVTASGRFPGLFASEYAAGEVSGRLEESLGRLHRYYKEEGTRRMRAAAQWTPRLIYLAIVLMIAWRIVSFYAGYFRQIGEVLKF